MDTFNYMRAFRRIVELGSLAKAAEVLDMSSAGLSKQLRALESHLGAVLIQRTTRKMSLTDTGTAYYAECCRLLDELDALEKSVRQQSQRVSGRLRVNAPLSFALSVLSPLLARFLRQYPELRLDLSMEDRLVDAVGQGFDVSIRPRAQLEDSTLIARRLVSLTQVLCAAPSYLQAHGHPRDAGRAARACDPELQPGGWRRLGRGIRQASTRRPARTRPGQQQPDAARPAGRRPASARCPRSWPTRPSPMAAWRACCRTCQPRPGTSTRSIPPAATCNPRSRPSWTSWPSICPPPCPAILTPSE